MSSYLSSRAKTDYPLCAPRRDAESLLQWDRGSSGTAPRHKPSNYSTSDAVLPIGEFRQPRSGPLMLLFANSLDGVRGGLVSGIQPAMGGLEGISRVGRTLGTPDAHPNLKEEPLWGQPPPAVRRSAAPLTVQHSCPPSPKKLRWRTGVPARPGSSAGVPPNSPPATPNHVGTAAPGCPAERSSARCSDTSVRHLQKNFGGGRASPPVKVRALACFPNSLPHHEPRRGGRIWKKNRVRAAFSYPPTNRRNPFQKHGKSGVTTPTTNLLKMVFWSCAYVPLAG